MRQQMAMQEQQRQQEEWARQQFLAQQQQSLLAQPTGYGSNNPFAPGGGGLSAQQTSTPQPATSSFLPVPVVSQQAPSPQPQQQQQQRPIEPQQTAKPAFQAPPPKDDGEHSGLAALLARGREDGLDTFGNVGALRECLAYLRRNDVSSLTCIPRYSRWVRVPPVEQDGGAADWRWRFRRQQSVRSATATEADRPAFLLRVNKGPFPSLATWWFVGFPRLHEISIQYIQDTHAAVCR